MMLPEGMNPIAAITVDPAKLVSNLGDTCYAIGTALKTANEESKKQGLSDEERQARRAKKVATLNAVIQNIEAIIQNLSKDDDNHHHINALSAIQKSCAHAMSLDYDCHAHHDHIDHAAHLAFAMAQSIRTTAERDDGGDETIEDHAAHSGKHAARIKPRAQHAPKRPTVDPLAEYKASPVIKKQPSGYDALASLSGDGKTPDNTIGAHEAALHGLIDGLAHKALH